MAASVRRDLARLRAGMQPQDQGGVGGEGGGLVEVPLRACLGERHQLRPRLVDGWHGRVWLLEHLPRVTAVCDGHL